MQGKLRSYRIHLASGVVFTDTQRFLCIVTDRERARATQGLLVPFEGDLLLSVILSKAALLVADDRIKDQSILKQLD